MITIRAEIIEEHTVILEEGVDYAPDDLVYQSAYPPLKFLPEDCLNELVKKHGFDRWTFSGHPEPRNELNGKTGIQVKFVRNLA